MKLYRLILIAALAASALTGLAAAQDESWTLVGAERLLEDMERIFAPTLSPDGSTIAWWDMKIHAVCTYTLDDAAPICGPPPTEGIPSIHYLAWSPDGAYIAFTPEFFRFFHEPDIWVYDVAAGVYTNLTDDGVDDFDFEDNPDMMLDLLPTWHPVTGDLYFFQITHAEDLYTLALHRVAPEGGEPVPVYDLTFDLPQGFPVWQPPAFSPDGTQLALLVTALKPDDPANGIWLFDLEEEKLTQIMAQGDYMRAGIPDWYDESYYAIPNEIAWVAGGEGLLFSAFSQQYIDLFGPGFYYLDMATYAVTPMVDLSDVPDEKSFFISDNDAPTALYRVPRWGMVAPDGGSFFYIHHEQSYETAGVSALPLPPDGSAPDLLGEIAFVVAGARGTPPYLTTVKADGRALVLYHNLLTFE